MKSISTLNLENAMARCGQSGRGSPKNQLCSISLKRSAPGSNIHRPFHILFIVENNSVPVDIRVWREAVAAKEAGCHVSVISPKNKQFSKKYEIIDGIEIYRHPMRPKDAGIINQAIEYANALFWEAILSAKIFLKRRFDVIHGANPPDHIFLLALAFRLAGVKYIFDHHDLAPELYISKFNRNKDILYCLLKLMEKLSCLVADVIICTNQSCKLSDIERSKVKQEKIFVVRNDPSLQRNTTCYKEVNEKKINDDNIILLYVGSINIQDGMRDLMKVVHILVNQFKQTMIHCRVIGDGDDLFRVKQLCEELKMNKYFSFLGYVYDRETVRKHIVESDICLEPAPDNEVNSKSTFIKVMEYMAEGKPIVAFDMAETRFSAEGAALMVEPGNHYAFAEAIMRLIGDPKLRRHMGEFGRVKINTELNWCNASRELYQAYRAIRINSNQL